MNKTFDPSTVHPVQFSPDIGCNVPNETIIAQTSANIRRMLPQAQPFQPNGDIVALICGGPSLASTEKELVDAVWRGAKVIAVNGAYQWCIDRNIRPSGMVMLDAREFNSRFVETPVHDCRYMLASQCHPKAFDLCRGRDVTIWHACSAGDDEHKVLKDYYFERTFPVTDGTTVAIRAIALFTMLGFRSFDIFGLDSCWMGDAHHSYAQAENDRDERHAVWLRPEGHDELAHRFECAPWHLKQAQDFQELMIARSRQFRLNVRGDGLIATMMRIAGALGSIVAPEIGD